MDDRKTFLFFASWADSLADLPPLERCEAYDAIIAYARTGEAVEPKSPLARIAFRFMRQGVDESLDKYDKSVEQRREAAKRRWELRKAAEQAAAPTPKPESEAKPEPEVKPSPKSKTKPEVEPEAKPEPEASVKQSPEYAFEEFRRLYPGSKRGARVEFEYFKSTVPEWRSVLPLLLPAAQRLIDWTLAARAAGQFAPGYKSLREWIRLECWTEEFPEITGPDRAAVSKQIQNDRDECHRQRDERDAAEDRLQERYKQRIPHAFTPQAPLSFLQYRLLDLDTTPDSRLADMIDDIRARRLFVPTDAGSLLKLRKRLFENSC